MEKSLRRAEADDDSGGRKTREVMMWPFTRVNYKVSTFTQCESGVLEHDDEHHIWGNWLMVRGTSYSIFTKEGTPITRQMRTCIVCGFTETKSL